jgi:hypothetical protein
MSEKLHRRICQMPSAKSEVEGCNLGNNDRQKASSTAKQTRNSSSAWALALHLAGSKHQHRSLVVH